ncbi:MAG: UDP-N-acetylmuramate--L-alanine ligase [Candidatus Nomurabacteria bacterium]|nr:UDP-N-acetylmuramate--L-alanine ligase [Candidatus Nomurabacteria bacterium]
MKIFCSGIGGIGLSALARYYKYKGHDVAGSDLHDSDLIQALKKEGIEITIGQTKENISKNIDLFVYTIALPIDHPEFSQVLDLGINHKTYPEALGDVTKEKETIAICGTHGKTTTTAMMYYAMKACGINPTVIVGSLLSGVGTNFIPGDSKYMVVEACEYKRSFLNLHPSHIIITNIDLDHLDYYKDIDDIQNAFEEFASKLPAGGYLVSHSGIGVDPEIRKDEIDLSVWGNHNRSNAELVISLCKKLGFDEMRVRAGLKEFKGTWRRMEYKGRTANGVEVYDDYGHHPRELNATFQGLYEKYPKEKYNLHVFFQPHLYSRTKIFMDEFAESLAIVDFVYVMPIFAAREKHDDSRASQMLVDKINNKGGNAVLLGSKDEIVNIIQDLRGEVIAVNIGAGDAYAELKKIKLL